MIRRNKFCGIIFLGLLTAACNSSTQQGANADTVVVTKQAEPASGSKKILFFGNSLTAGYGLQPEEAFTALIQEKLDSLDLPYTTVNAGVSGETSSAGNSRIDWLLKNHVDIFVLELGANDGLRGIPVTETAKNLQSIIDKVKGKYPEAKLILAGMQVPPNMGRQYSIDFKNAFSTLAEKNDMALIPFLLQGVGGEPSMNLPDGIHPNAEGEKIVAENVWTVLQPIL